MDLQLDVASGIDVRRDFQDDADVFIGDAGVLGAGDPEIACCAGTGTCWPTNSLPVSLSRMLICGSARTVASVVRCRNWMRKSMLMVLLSTPERREVSPSAPGVVVVNQGIGGSPKPFW